MQKQTIVLKSIETGPELTPLLAFL